MNDASVQTLLRLITAKHPKWQGFDDAGFVRDELAPTRAAVAKAQQWLSPQTLTELQRADQHDEILARFRRLASETNLLYLAVPKAGDLGLLNQGIAPALLCAALSDLLHGAGASPQRLGRFVDFVQSVGGTPKWALPTYYLFLVHPATDIFIKPTVFKNLLALVNADELWSTAPSAAAYAQLLELCHALRTQLATFGAHDMVDVLGAIWVAAAQSKKKPATNTTRTTATAAVNAHMAETRAVYATTHIAYTLETCAADTGLPTETLQAWLRSIARKKQAIFYGPPGTGKTFVAQKLAQHLIAGGDGFVDLVQFHPAYAYEDFVQGMRPRANAHGAMEFPMVAGRFLDFCERARVCKGSCVLIIDEVNRANIARVFGELMYALEYRDADIVLASGQTFRIPPNAILLGTMNTADRSIALVDHALRRRFAFLALQPNYDLLRQFHANESRMNRVNRVNNRVNIEGLVELLTQINHQHIADPNYAIGTSFFLVPNLAEQLEDIWRTEIEPYLEEYFFDQPARIEEFRWDNVWAVLLPTEAT
jgi:MoxR-like ATPase